MKLQELAALLGCQLEGDASAEISGVASLEDADTGDISFFANPKYKRALESTRAGAVIVGPAASSSGRNLLRNNNPYLTFAKAIEVFHKASSSVPSVHPSARISPSAVVGKSATVSAGAFIGDRVLVGERAFIGETAVICDDAQIGEDTVVKAGCVIGARVEIGRRCTLDFNCVIGAEGFAYAPNEDGTWYKIYQAGRVVVEDDVGIGACTCVARATVGETRIKSGAKIDALVQVGHSSVIGERSLLCSQVGLAGSTKVGSGVILAGQVGVAGHLTIGDKVRVAAQAGIGTSIPEGSAVGGSPSFEHSKWLRAVSAFKGLPELQIRMNRLAKELEALERIFKEKL